MAGNILPGVLMGRKKEFYMVGDILGKYSDWLEIFHLKVCLSGKITRMIWLYI